MYKQDLIEKICKGQDKEYENKYCNFFSYPKNCRILEGRNNLREIFADKELRCKPEDKLKKYVERFLKKYKDTISETDIQSIAFEAQKKIENNCLKKKYNIHYLYSYIKKAAKTATLDFLSMFSPLKPICNNCIYLLPDREKKFKCSREILINSDNNKNFEKKRKPSDKACKYGYEKIIIQPNVEEIDVPDESSKNSCNIEDSIIDKFLEILKNRPSKSKKIIRQNQVYIRLFQLLKANENLKMYEIYETIAKELDISTKTVERDLEDIREYFKKNVSLNDFISS